MTQSTLNAHEESERHRQAIPLRFISGGHNGLSQQLAPSLFAQLVHDPEDLWRWQNPGQEPNQQVRGHWTKARAKLFTIVEDLVKWENIDQRISIGEGPRGNSQGVAGNVRAEQEPSTRRRTCSSRISCPACYDPFAGGGSIPLEAQRLGLNAYASDLNPVAVVINKAMIEIPPKFAGKPPVHPDAKNPLLTWSGMAGLAEDVRSYGAWMRAEAFKRIGHLYPPIEITKAMVKDRPDLKQYEGEKLTVIAWLWARTVKSPNPAFSHVEVPLASTFILSNKEGKESYVQPVIEKGSYHFTVIVGKPPPEAKVGTTAGKRAAFLCLMSKAPMDYDYIRKEGQAGRMGQKLMAIVAEGKRGRVYLAPTAEHEALAATAKPEWKPDLKLPDNPRDFKTPNYGLMTFGDLFTPRQLVALTTFSDLVGEARERIRRDAVAAGLPDDDHGIDAGGNGARAYAEAVSVYLWCVLARVLHYSSTNCTWLPKDSAIARTFTKQAIPMSWDYAEGSVFEKCSTEWDQCSHVITCCMGFFSGFKPATVDQSDAAEFDPKRKPFISTDPPYYDNVGYADLSDFFYVWLRRTLRAVYPHVLSTIAVPKTEELVATPYRHGGKEKAESFFLDGMTRAMHKLAEHAHPAAPITIYYAFKQSETETEGTNSTGWETFLEAVNRAGLSVTGTWPMRTEGDNRQMGQGTNALASSIILVCRARTKDVGTISRRQFVRMLNEALPLALDAMTRESEGLHSPVAPVDLSQAIIGPGMAIFSRYDAVLEADGTAMTVRTALQLINRFLAEDDFDPDTQFCLHWFEQHGWETAKFGEADTLARAKGTSVVGVQQSGVVEAGGGNVRILKWKEYPDDWDPATDARLPVWEALHQLIRAYNTDGDCGAAKVLAGVAGKAEAARQLAYRLYTLCERAGRAEDARAYNEVVTGWSGIESAAVKVATPQQRSLFDIVEAP